MERPHPPSSDDQQGIESLMQRMRHTTTMQQQQQQQQKQGLWPILMSGPNDLTATVGAHHHPYRGGGISGSSNNINMPEQHHTAGVPPYHTYHFRQQAEQEREMMLRSLLSQHHAGISMQNRHLLLSGMSPAELMSHQRSSLLQESYMRNSVLSGLSAAGPVDDLILRASNSGAILPHYQQNMAFAAPHHHLHLSQQLPVVFVDPRMRMQGTPRFEEIDDEEGGSQGRSRRKRKIRNNSQDQDSDTEPPDDNRKRAAQKAPECAETREYNAESFAQRLFRMIADQEAAGLHDTVEFLDGGGGFWLHNQDKLVKELMPTYFRARKFSAFRRQLVSYGFKRENNLCPHRGAFKHPLFSRDRPELCKGITRDKRYDRRNRKKKSKKAPKAKKQGNLKEEEVSESEGEEESGGE